MPEATLRIRGLVLYKNRPARIEQVDRKIEIELRGGDRLSVRPKDVTLLHPGPVASLTALEKLDGDVETAWELLSGETTDLPELAELIYGEYTPQTAWAAWQLLNDGLYFSGNPDEILAHTRAAVAAERENRRAKAAEEQAWQAFTARVSAGEYLPEDERYLKEVESLALGTHARSRVLSDLGHGETPQNAHAFLLRLGYWDHAVNPHARREGLPDGLPDLPLPDLPEEARRDLTHLTALAIDDEGNVDPDDAISLEDDRLWVHIADVAALVPPYSPADLEARARGANLYLPEGVIPMLPREATRTLGLGLAETSAALSIGMRVGADGHLSDIEVAPSWVRVSRLSYEAAEARLDESMLRELYLLARRFEARRCRDGAIQLDLPEVKVSVEDGRVSIRPLPPLRSRDLVREAMLMAGEAVAIFAQEHDLAIPYTVQDAPDSDEAPKSEASSVSSLAAMFATRRSLKRGRKQMTPAPHAGLGMAQYVQATSPLRRYLDLVVHQQIRAFVRGESPLDEQALMERVAAVEAMAGATRYAERQSITHWTLVYLIQNPDWRGEGVVVDKRGARNHVLIPELGLESFLYGSQNLPLDGRVFLALREVNLPELEAHFQVVPS